MQRVGQVVLTVVSALTLLPLMSFQPLQVGESDERVLDEDPLHRVIELELGEEGAHFEYLSDFAGSLIIWASSEVVDPELSVRVEGYEKAFEDSDSGGGTTAWLLVEIEEYKAVAIRIESSNDEAGRAELHIIAAPETEATLRVAAEGVKELEVIEELRTAGEPESARERLSTLYASLNSTEGVNTSWKLGELVSNTGFSAYRLSNLALAAQAWESSHPAQERVFSPGHSALLEAKVVLAWIRGVRGNLRGKLELESQVHSVRERLLPADDLKLLEIKHSLGITRGKLGDLQGALELKEYVHEARERLLPADDPDLLSAKSNLAVTRKHLGDLAGSLELEEYVHAARERLLAPEDPELLSSKVNLAVTRKLLGDLDGALELLEYVHEIWERTLPATHPNLMAVKGNLAATLNKLGEYERALTLEEFVHDAREEQLSGDHPDLLTAKMNLAVTRQKLGDLQGSLELFEQVYSARVRSLPSEHPDLLAAKNNLAATRLGLGDFQGANTLIEAVHAVRERLLPPEHPELLAVKQNLALTRKQLGDLAGALELEEYVHEVRERLLPPGHADLLAAKGNLAATRSELQDFDGALRLFSYVDAELGQLLPPEHPMVLGAKQNLAVTLNKLGDLETALELFEALHEARERLLPPEHSALLAAKTNLAVTRTDLGDLQGALALSEHVHDVWKRSLPPGHANLLNAKQNLADLYSELGEFEKLKELTSSLLRAEVTLAEGLQRHAPRLGRSAVIRELDRLAKELLWSDQIEAHDGTSLNAEALLALESLRLASVSSPEVMRAARALPELAETLEALEQAARRASEVAQSAPDGEATDPEEAAEEWRTRLVRAGEERDALQRKLRIQIEERGLLGQMATLAELAERLGAGEALVSFLRYPRFEAAEGGGGYTTVDSFLAFVLTPDAAVRRIELGSANDLEEKARAWRASVGSPLTPRGLGFGTSKPSSEEQVAALGAELRSALLDPVFASVSDVREFHIVLDDFLYLLPLDALPLGEGLVGEKFELHSLTTIAPLLNPAHQPTGELKLVAFGDVDYDGRARGADQLLELSSSPPVPRVKTESPESLTFEELPGTADEVAEVARLFRAVFDIKAKPLTGRRASKKELVKLASQARYLHIATHGWFVPASEAASMWDSVGNEQVTQRLIRERTQSTLAGYLPESLCGLALAGAGHGVDSKGHVPGILTAEELMTLDLSNCELAVLSACETNVGIRRAGQGIQSLQTSLHAAGVRTAITSLWKVDDEATRRLFEVFYSKLWEEGVGAAGALWEAKMVLRGEGQPQRNWAGWVLTGAAD